jgi:hypothetical protein
MHGCSQLLLRRSAVIDQQQQPRASASATMHLRAPLGQLLLLLAALTAPQAAALQVCPGTPQNHSAPTTHKCANECCTHR